jgi:hypothetical protein
LSLLALVLEDGTQPVSPAKRQASKVSRNAFIRRSFKLVFHDLR